MRRVSVVGNSGSGKSTLAAEVARRIGGTFTELDSVYHQANWEPLPTEEFRERVTKLVASEPWVIDGNYSMVQDLIWEAADTVVWLDLPRWSVIPQLVVRTLRRMMSGRELWNGNRESFSDLFTLDRERSIILWSWTQHTKVRQKYEALMADPSYAHLRFVRLRSRSEVRVFLSTLGEGSL